MIMRMRENEWILMVHVALLHLEVIVNSARGINGDYGVGAGADGSNRINAGHGIGVGVGVHAI